MKSFRRFLVFLAENKTLSRYFTNLEAQYIIFRDKNCSGLIDSVVKLNPLLYLTNSFNWSYTPEGVDYWTNLHLLWSEVVKQELFD